MLMLRAECQLLRKNYFETLVQRKAKKNTNQEKSTPVFKWIYPYYYGTDLPVAFNEDGDLCESVKKAKVELQFTERPVKPMYFTKGRISLSYHHEHGSENKLLKFRLGVSSADMWYKTLFETHFASTLIHKPWYVKLDDETRDGEDVSSSQLVLSDEFRLTLIARLLPRIYSSNDNFKVESYFQVAFYLAEMVMRALACGHIYFLVHEEMYYTYEVDSRFARYKITKKDTRFDITEDQFSSYMPDRTFTQVNPKNNDQTYYVESLINKDIKSTARFYFSVGNINKHCLFNLVMNDTEMVDDVSFEAVGYFLAMRIVKSFSENGYKDLQSSVEKLDLVIPPSKQEFFMMGAFGIA